MTLPTLLYSATTPVRFLSPTDAARYLSTSVQHLARLRCEARGPRWFKVGRKLVRYEQGALDQWLTAQTHARARHRNGEGVA